MKVEVGEHGNIVLRDVFNSIVLVSQNNEEFVICMRDGGFEFKFGDTWHSAKYGTIGFLFPLEENED